VSLEATCCSSCALFCGLEEVTLLDLTVGSSGGLVMTIETMHEVVGCPACGSIAHTKDRDRVSLVDLACFGRPTTTVWVKRRFECRDPDCPMQTWTEQDERITPVRTSMTTRAGRWATHQVGAHARSVAEVAADLGCGSTVNDAVLAYGEALLEADSERVGDVGSLGLDEVAFAKLLPHRRLAYATSIVDTGTAQLLDVVPGRGGAEPKRWIEDRGEVWRDHVEWATLDLSGTFRAVFEATLPNATMVADPFHVVKHANSKLDECRRRVQNQTLGHRGRKHDPLFRSRRLLTLPKNASPRAARRSSWDCYGPGTPRARSLPHGMPKKLSASSTPTPTSRPPRSGSTT
jgi:transposase